MTVAKPPQSIKSQLTWSLHWPSHGSHQNLLSPCSSTNHWSTPQNKHPLLSEFHIFLHASSLIQALPETNTVISFPRVWILILQVQEEQSRNEERRRTCPQTGIGWHWLSSVTPRGMPTLQRLGLLQVLWENSGIPPASGRSLCSLLGWLEGIDKQRRVLGWWGFTNRINRAPKYWGEMVQNHHHERCGIQVLLESWTQECYME